MKTHSDLNVQCNTVLTVKLSPGLYLVVLKSAGVCSVHYCAPILLSSKAVTKIPLHCASEETAHSPHPSTTGSTPPVVMTMVIRASGKVRQPTLKLLCETKSADFQVRKHPVQICQVPKFLPLLVSLLYKSLWIKMIQLGLYFSLAHGNGKKDGKTSAFLVQIPTRYLFFYIGLKLFSVYSISKEHHQNTMGTTLFSDQT